MKRKISVLANKIKMIAMDVDGVLTSGEIIILNSGEEIKIWDVKDGLSFHLARLSGADLKFVWITGRSSKQVAERAKDMRIDLLIQNCMQKKKALKEAEKKFKVKPEEIAYIGDDFIDILPLRYAGFSVCPSDAPEEVKKEVDYVSPFPGGKGVVREVIEIVLKSRSLWQKAIKIYTEDI